MNEVFIHPTAIVDPNAKLGVNVKIGPFSIIESDVEIGDNTQIMSSVYIHNYARIGKNNKIYPYVVIATEPQDLKFQDTPTYVEIGDDNTIREYSTINRGTEATGKTVLGNNNLIMEYCHIAHDCKLGNNIVMANVSQFAGHVHIEDWANLGAYTKVHQFCTIGKYSFIGADTKIVKDVPPYSIVSSPDVRFKGINLIGLRRRGFSESEISEISQFYKFIFNSGYNNTDGIRKYLEDHTPSANVQYIIDFIQKSERGIYRS